MKRVLSILLAVLMLASLLTVTSGARGYTLTIPETVSAHNLEAYGLHTMNVFSTSTPTTVDGVISEGEYPGPNNGRALSSTPGDNLWMNAYYHAPGSEGTAQTSYYPECDWTEYVDKRDMPDYINSYLTYDDEYLYYAVSTVIPAIRPTTDNAEGASRAAQWFMEVRCNFMQSDNLAISQGGNSSSFVNTRYTLYKALEYDGEGNPVAQVAQSVAQPRKVFTLYQDDKFVSTTLPTYVDAIGQSWNSNIYKRAENFSYKVTILENNKWGVVFEGRLPLGDVLRLTDVEYDDGTPIDYVPEWGCWGTDLRLQAYYGKTSTLPNGSEVVIRPEDVLYAQTFLPTGGAANSAVNSTVAGYLLNNTISAAVTSIHGKGSVGNTFWMNPVHFLGVYDSTFDYADNYSVPTDTVMGSTTSRVTRTRGALTSGVRGINNRVVAVATKAAVATGDDLTLTIVCSVAMILCAAAAVTVIIMKKRSAHKN